VLLLGLLWLTGAFDLALTLFAQRIGGFAEKNPIAHLLLGNTFALIAFKLSALALASAIFIKLRRHRLAEAACWGLCAVHVALALVWLSYYNTLAP